MDKEEVDKQQEPTENLKLKNKCFKPTIESYAPHVFVSLLGVLPTVLLWETYSRISTTTVLIFAILFSLLALRIVPSTILVFLTSACVSCKEIKVRSLFGAICVEWQDVRGIRIVEKDRNYLPPYRTSRMVQISYWLFAQKMIILNTDAWPQSAEEEFLRGVNEVAICYGIPVQRVTTNI